MAQTATHHQCARSSAPPALRFCPAVAAALGVSEAIVIDRLRFWLGRSKHVFDGRTWVYNTYSEWQKQFPFWSVRTIQETFRRLERDGILLSTNRYNKSRYDRTKWYTIDEAALAKRLSEAVAATTVQTAAVEAEGDVLTSAPAAAIEAEEAGVLEAAEAVCSQNPVRSSMSSSREIPKRGCARKLGGGARAHPLEDTEPVVTTCRHGENPVNELDAAYEAIPEAERESWYERADRALEAAGMPGWMRIAPTVKEAALPMWVGSTIPVLASG